MDFFWPSNLLAEKKVNKCIFISIGQHWDSENSLSLQYKVIADRLVSRGYKLVILVPGKVIDKEVLGGNQVVLTWPSYRPTKFPDFIFLVRLIRKNNPVMVIGNFSSVNLMILIGWFYKVKCRIAWYHTLTEQIEIDHSEPLPLKIFHHARKKFIYSLSSAIVSVSEYAKINDLVRRYNIPTNKVAVFHNKFQSHDVLSNKKRKSMTLVCIARLENSKGQDILLRAMPTVINSFPDVQLRLIGDGGNKSKLEELCRDLKIRENVQFLGSLSPTEVLLEFSTTTICIHPARFDNCPLSLIEALSVGTPIIASRVGGIPEIIEDNVTGLLFNPDNIDVLASLICFLLSSSAIQKKFSENALTKFYGEFEIIGGVDKIVDWLENQIISQEEK